MAALCAGVQYGLSSKGSFNENKDFIFVKLTDSAIRAIEEYVRNKNKLNQSPTIQFLGNEGHLSFPSIHSSNNGGSTAFTFALSSAADTEGPGGSFECIRHVGRNDLSVLGALSHKMRVQANDDVYAATKHRMAVAEENQKNKCTRVIKPNQTDIGRKVKVKQTGARIPPISGAVGSSSNNNSVSSMRRELPPATAKPPLTSRPPSSNGSLVTSSSIPSRVPLPQQVKHKPAAPVPNIMKRPIKERLIHLLASRPYKKPELFDRLHKDGLRDREKNCIINVLQQIAVMRDNTYHLLRHVWNDVHDDWPFYTEQEKQMLKRRKPQNLTPPGSSDGGSSGSGQSPTSTHPGSPPPPISSSTGAKRPGYYDGADGLPTKRQRISHYRKPPEENNVSRRPATDSRDASNMNPRSREPPNGYLYESSKRPYSDDDEDDGTGRKHDGLSFGVSRDKTYVIDSECVFSQSKLPDADDRSKSSVPPRSRQEDKEQMRWNKVTSTTHQNGNMQEAAAARVSPDSSQTEPKEETTRFSIPNSIPPEPEVPDYLDKYTQITDVEQRRSYKTDFNADYPEYRELHGAIERVSRRFAELEERLKQEDQSSPGYKEIRKQIIREYQENKNDIQKQRAKRRFQYLHEKLSHIKRLVAEYDERQSGGGY